MTKPGLFVLAAPFGWCDLCRVRPAAVEYGACGSGGVQVVRLCRRCEGEEMGDDFAAGDEGKGAG